MHAFTETEKDYLKTVPAFRAGDTLRVNVRVKEGEKERLQAFEGVCIARRGNGVGASFTVRKISNGVGVERIFPLHSPMPVCRSRRRGRPPRPDPAWPAGGARSSVRSAPRVPRTSLVSMKSDGAPWRAPSSFVR